MENKANHKHQFLVTLGLVLTFFSSACLWNEQSLGNYILCSIVVVGISFITFFLYTIINNRYIGWIVITYSIFELYGLLFLRIGAFNWDFILVSGIIQISITVMIMTLRNKDEVISVLCKSCLIAIVIVCSYMVKKGSIKLSNITFGSSFGLELSGNRNTVATIIGLMLIPVSFLAINEKKYRIIYIAIAIFSSGCMLLTGSKKGIIVLLLIIMMIFFIDRGAFKYLIFPIVIAFGIYAVFNIPILYNVVGYRLKDMFATLGIGTAVTNAQSTNIRSSFISMGLRSMWNHPIFGGGMNYFQFINNTRYYSHNNYIELLNNFGILGFSIYYIPIFKKIPILYKDIKNNKGKESFSESVFLFVYLVSKIALDYAMVSYSAMCVFNIQVLIIFEILRRENIKNEKT